MDKAKAGKFEGGLWGWMAWAGGCSVVKTEMTVLEQQYK